jgi:hypothetical protein
MTTALPSLTQVVHNIHVSCVSPEAALADANRLLQ